MATTDTTKEKTTSSSTKKTTSSTQKKTTSTATTKKASGANGTKSTGTTTKKTSSTTPKKTMTSTPKKQDTTPNTNVTIVADVANIIMPTKQAKQVKKAEKLFGTGGLIALALCLVVGIAIGYFVVFSICKNDTFKVNEQTDYSFEYGTTVSYSSLVSDYKVIELGKEQDKDKVKVTTDLTLDGDGNITSEVGSYTITYSYTTFLGKTISKYRYIIITEPEVKLNGSEGVSL